MVLSRVWGDPSSMWVPVMPRDRFVTTILLDEETKGIARTLPNLSWFVRDALRTHRDTTSRTVLPDHPRYDITLGCCSPFTPTGICGVCWPDGAPTRKDWLEFVRMRRAGTSANGEPLDHRSLWPVPTVYEDRGQYLPSGSPHHRQRKPGLLTRIFRFLF